MTATLEISRQEAAQELLQRRWAKDRLMSFTQYTNKRYMVANHHELIASKLEDVEAGRIDRLMIFMPPRHGKSELASKRFPAWFLGKNPGKEIIASSYSTDIAEYFGREVRNLIDSQEYNNVFEEVELRPDSKAAQRWNTNQGGAYIAAGVRKGITGRGAHILLIDDPVKDREEADSEVIREKVWNWYTSTAYSRLEPDGAVVLIQTRWHEDDLAGRLLEEMKSGGDQWEVLSLPAINEKGKALWPDRFPVEVLEQKRRVMGSRDWGALYQQNPTPEEGNFFKREWIRWYDHEPKYLKIYGASDYAVTEDGGDYTCHGVAGVDPDDNLFILDWWRGQTATDVWIEVLLQAADTWKPLEWGEEKGQIEKSVGPFITRRQRETQNYFYRKQFTSANDKPTRAQAFRGRMAQGKVFFPRNAPWVNDLISELMAFPAGKNDDQVDVLSLFGRMLARMVAGRVPKPDEPVRYKNDIRTMTINAHMEALKRKRLERDG